MRFPSNSFYKNLYFFLSVLTYNKTVGHKYYILGVIEVVWFHDCDFISKLEWSTNILGAAY